MTTATAPATLPELLDECSVDGETIRDAVNLECWSFDDPDTDRWMEDLVAYAADAGWFGGHEVRLVLAPPHDDDGLCYGVLTITLAGIDLQLGAHCGLIDQLLGPLPSGVVVRTPEQLAQALLDGVTAIVEHELDRARTAGLAV